MEFKYNDGGRKEFGFEKGSNDCVIRAIAIATQVPYDKVWEGLNELSRDACFMLNDPRAYKPYLKSLGWIWTPTMSIGSGTRIHLTRRELPKGRLICRVTKHLTAVVDGIINDTHNPSRNETRCVYGYWEKMRLN